MKVRQTSFLLSSSFFKREREWQTELSWKSRFCELVARRRIHNQPCTSSIFMFHSFFRSFSFDHRLDSSSYSSSLSSLTFSFLSLTFLTYLLCWIRNGYWVVERTSSSLPCGLNESRKGCFNFCLKPPFLPTYSYLLNCNLFSLVHFLWITKVQGKEMMKWNHTSSMNNFFELKNPISHNKLNQWILEWVKELKNKRQKSELRDKKKEEARIWKKEELKLKGLQLQKTTSVSSQWPSKRPLRRWNHGR